MRTLDPCGNLSRFDKPQDIDEGQTPKSTFTSPRRVQGTLMNVYILIRCIGMSLFVPRQQDQVPNAQQLVSPNEFISNIQTNRSVII